MPCTKHIIVAVSGASGICYAVRLMECLLAAGCTISVLFSKAARAVAALETDLELPAGPQALGAYFQARFNVQAEQLTVYGEHDWQSSLASGSHPADAMVICPCSSGCLSAVATGASNNLLERSADVMIKEQRQLIIVHRETPISGIHLENMLTLARYGVTILPANPGFYHQPDTLNDLIDFVVARILDHLGVAHQLVPRWGKKESLLVANQ